MATTELEPKYLTAGREFDQALSRLGFEPEGIFWGYDEEVSQHVLLIVTGLFDYTGPLEISRQLFKAYNASATPKEIDPFVVRLHSISQPAGKSLLEFAAGDFEIQRINKATGKPDSDLIPVKNVKSYGIELRKEWVIEIRPIKKHKTTDMSRKWARFTRNVDKVAA